MQRVRIRSLSVAMIAISTITASFAQPIISTSYLDRDYHPASERSYAFKRVIKFNGEILNLHIKMDKDGLQTLSHIGSGVYACSLTDYFPSGEPALVANVESRDMLCREWWFEGKVVYFYRSGRIRRTEFYNLTKLQGDVITYAEDGRILTREHYEGGLLIDNRGYAVDPNHPLIGKWKTRGCADYNGPIHTCLKYTLLWIISSNGILHTQFVSESQANNWETQTNWKYASTAAGTGVLEAFQGETLIERGDIRWISSNEFEDTVAFSQDPNLIGHRMRFVSEEHDRIR